MKARYRLTRRGSRGDTFYCKDTKTGKRTIWGTRDENAAQQIVNARNQAEQQPLLNLQLAKAYFLGSGSVIPKRTWWDAIDLGSAERGVFCLVIHTSIALISVCQRSWLSSSLR